jgi:hypothetical protein
MAVVTFYHGGGQWIGSDVVVTYNYIDKYFASSMGLPADWLPGLPACWPPRTSGWEVRVAAGFSHDRGYYAQTWLRRVGTTGRWLILYAESPLPELRPELLTVVATLQPDARLWSPR